MGIKEQIEKVREELHSLITKYGTKDKKILKKSQELDLLLNQYGVQYGFTN